MNEPRVSLDQKYVIDKTSGCWNFTGCLTDGYGMIGIKSGGMARAHKVSPSRRYRKRHRITVR